MLTNNLKPVALAEKSCHGKRGNGYRRLERWQFKLSSGKSFGKTVANSKLGGGNYVLSELAYRI